MKTRKQPANVVFFGRGPFSKKLQDILVEECTRAEVPKPVLRSFGRAFSWPDILPTDWDLAFVVTPPQAHEQLIPALWLQAQQKRGGSRISSRRRPIWVEKPFCSSSDAAHSLTNTWLRLGQPPTYVDFTHLQDPLVEVLKHRVGGAEHKAALTALYGNRHYTPRSYMSLKWDWGAHCIAMQEWLGLQASHMDLLTIDGAPPYRLGWELNSIGVEQHNWAPDGKGLQRGMRAMLATVYGTPTAGLEVPNWNLEFATRVTEELEQNYGPCEPE